MDTQENAVLHVIVIGFHHKKGCQVEYAYPPLISGQSVDSSDLPAPWKHLPSLALPDGAHNFEKDTIFFHLPSLENPRSTVYGISCYRQMNAERLLNKSSDITRGTVQKSVCVISTLPLYGLIQAKLELITHAYFDERDFSKVALLEETFCHLNSSLTQEMVWRSQAFLGLSVRDLIFHFRHKVLILFKLLLLERKVLFYKSPVKDLCSTILTLCSLFPGMIEKGMNEAAAGIGSRLTSPEIREHKEFGYLEVCYSTDDSVAEPKASPPATSTFFAEISSADLPLSNAMPNHVIPEALNACRAPESIKMDSTTDDHTKTLNDLVKERVSLPSNGNGAILDTTEEDKLLQELDEILDKESASDSCRQNCDLVSKKVFVGHTLKQDADNALHEPPNPDEASKKVQKPSNSKSISSLDGVDKVLLSSLPSSSSLITLELEACGLPLEIFTKGALCLPYLSLPFIDLLSDVSVRSFVVGATNVLFKQKRQLFDVIVEIDEGNIIIVDVELRKHLNLTMEDLRFAENLIQHITGDSQDIFLDGTGWEGGDEWLRSQFRLYLLSLLRTSELSDVSRESEAFNPGFYGAWQTTHNFRVWTSGGKFYPGIQEVEPRHPYQRGQLSVSDMKLKLSHTMQSSEKGKKLNNAVVNTSKAVMQTGRVVGGALSSAKTFVSSWLSTLNQPRRSDDPTFFDGEHADEAHESIETSSQQ